LSSNNEGGDTGGSVCGFFPTLVVIRVKGESEDSDARCQGSHVRQNLTTSSFGCMDGQTQSSQLSQEGLPVALGQRFRRLPPKKLRMRKVF